MSKKIAFITGASRGIGLGLTQELLRQDYQVIATCRDPKKAQSLQELATQSSNLEIHALDVTSDEQIHAILKNMDNRPIDRLILNAGITEENDTRHNNISRENLRHLFETNAISPLKIASCLLPLVKASQERLIVAISSRKASIADNRSGGMYAYRGSKNALNTMIFSLAHDTHPQGIHTLILHPGFVRTDMGGKKACISVQTSVDGMTILMRNARSYATGSFLAYDGNTIPW